MPERHPHDAPASSRAQYKSAGTVGEGGSSVYQAASMSFIVAGSSRHRRSSSIEFLPYPPEVVRRHRIIDVSVSPTEIFEMF
jgi:hypothetical protein